MAARYWVGGTGTWDATTTHWSATSGGAAGASVPTSADDVYFDSGSGTTGYVVTISSATCKSFIVDPTSPIFSFNGSGTLGIYGTLDFAQPIGWNATGPITFVATTTGWFVNSNGVSLPTITFNGVGGGWSLASALTSNGPLTVTNGAFTTNNFTVTANSLSSSTSSTRSIDLGSSTVTLSGTTPITFTTSTNLTFNASTSQINCSGGTWTFAGGGKTFYNVSFTSTAQTSGSITGANTFNNLTIAGRTLAGINIVSIAANQTINGTLTLSAGTNATMRTFLRSDTLGTTRTLTVNNFAAGSADIDFRDITIAGAAAPISGTRFSDCKGNSGITFPTAKTVYWNLSAGGNWSGTGWAATGGGAPAVTNFPLAQDTAVFQSTGLSSAATITVNANYNIGTIDMSARTTNTMTLSAGSTTPVIYGNWINGTGAALSFTGIFRFSGRASQTITSAGKVWPGALWIDSPGGTVTLQDAFSCSFANNGAFNLAKGAFNANNYNVTLTGTNSTVSITGTNTRTLAMGSGTWLIGSSFSIPWDASSSAGLTVTGTGVISLTSASSKTFAGGGVQTYPTLNQGGTGALTISGSNKFARMTNTAIGSVLFTGGTTNEFTTSFSLNGAAGTPLTLGSTTTTQAILKKPTAWQMGLLSTNAGNNTGLTFLASDGTMEYLSVSYINGQVTTPAVAYTGNFFAFF